MGPVFFLEGVAPPLGGVACTRVAAAARRLCATSPAHEWQRRRDDYVLLLFFNLIAAVERDCESLRQGRWLELLCCLMVMMMKA